MMKKYILAFLLLLINQFIYSQNCEELNKEVTALYEQGKIDDALKKIETAIAKCKVEYGEFSKEYASALNILAYLYNEQSNYKKAEPFYLKALSIQKQLFGIENSDYTVTLNNLAEMYSEMGNYGKAESIHLQVLEIRKKILGEDNPDYILTLNNQ